MPDKNSPEGLYITKKGREIHIVLVAEDGARVARVNSPGFAREIAAHILQLANEIWPHNVNPKLQRPG